jgi:peptide/nickel transport system substrate-binding protein
LEAYNRKEIMGISNLSPQKLSEIKVQKSTAIHKSSLPRYFAIFFNQTKSLSLSEIEVRKALNLATDHQEIIEKVLLGNGRPVYSPILPGMTGYSEELGRLDYNAEKAKEILESDGWKTAENGFRKKDDKPLEINLLTTDWEELVKTAEIIKSQWEKIGVKVNILSYSFTDVQQNYIKPREYEALLFGQVVGADPDPYAFWHSSNKKDPGANLSLFGDSETDKLIEDGRAEFENEKRAEIYKNFQEKLLAEIPAIFLYSPEYVHPANRKLQGTNNANLVSTSMRFSNINQWYIKTKRVGK